MNTERTLEALNLEMAGWTLQEWGRSEFSEAFRVVCVRDGRRKTVHLGFNDLGVWIAAVHFFDDQGREVEEDLDEMAFQICQHQSRCHPTPPSKPISEPESAHYASLEQYAADYLDYWFRSVSTVSQAFRLPSSTSNPNELRYALVDAAAWYEDGDNDVILKPVEGLKGSISYILIAPEDTEDFLQGALKLPSGWEIGNPVEMINPYFIPVEQQYADTLAQGQSLFESMDDAINLVIGYRCQRCKKEWWISARNILRCPNKKLVQIISHPESRMDILDERKYREEYL
jgi:hypothetical protein